MSYSFGRFFPLYTFLSVPALFVCLIGGCYQNSDTMKQTNVPRSDSCYLSRIVGKNKYKMKSPIFPSAYSLNTPPSFSGLLTLSTTHLKRELL